MNTILGDEASKEAMFGIMKGWTCQFDINGHKVGGTLNLDNDPRSTFHLGTLNGVKDKRILELGSLEGYHTKMLIDAGAREVIGIEGLSDCWLRCLIVKEAFGLDKAKFLFADFCKYIQNYKGEKFDIVWASGVLYHQRNPAQLIYELSKITDTVVVWSQVANKTLNSPSNVQGTVMGGGNHYNGKINNYNGTRLTSEYYCGGLHNEAFWMYPDEMLRCFKDAGFTFITQKDILPNINGDCLLFTAIKK